MHTILFNKTRFPQSFVQNVAFFVLFCFVFFKLIDIFVIYCMFRDSVKILNILGAHGNFMKIIKNGSGNWQWGKSFHAFRKIDKVKLHFMLTSTRSEQHFERIYKVKSHTDHEG